MINPLKAKLKKWPSLLLRPSLYCHATGVMRQRTRGGEIWLSAIDFERSWLEFSCWSSPHGCLNPKQTLLAVYHLHGKMVSKIRTGKFCPELVQIEGKTWNWNKRWLWRNGTRISVWNIPFRKTGVSFYILRCLLKFSAWSTLTFVFHIFFCWNKYLVLSWSFLLHFQGNNISLKFLHPWKEEKIGFGGKSSLSFGCVSKG